MLRSARWLCLVALAACAPADDPAPLRRDLAAGFEPGDLRDARGPWAGGLTLAPSELEADPYGMWVGATLASGDWAELAPGLWKAARPTGNIALLSEASTPERLIGPDGEYERIVAMSDVGAVASEFEPGTFGTVLDQLYLALAPGDAPPEGLVYETVVSRGRTREDAWRVELGQWAADGIPVWSGMSELVDLPRTDGAELLFATAAISPAARALDRESARGDVTFRLSLEGDELFEHAQAVTADGTLERHRVALPADASGTLELTVDGDPAIAAFLNPTLVVDPTPAAERARPDLLLYLADTFRADNMTAYGGQLDLTPNLDRYAANGLLFERAWTTAVWTLPSQASMLTGFLPFQHTATRPGKRIPSQAVTLAEQLRAAGYRTGAITDAGLVSRRHAFDQGFEFFDERFHDEVDTTHDAVRAFLEADDGRPTFLFVQSYRVHRPYRVTPETRAAHGERLGIVGEFDPTFAELEDAGWKSGASPLPPELEDTARRLQALYHGGVIDFDRQLGAFLDELTANGWFDNGTLLLTSDHGEAFGEHGALWHHVGVWETMARIPMWLHGHGIEPGTSAAPVSLVDVPSTLTDLAGIEPGDAWQSVSLLDAQTDRTVATFQCPPQMPGLMGIVDGDLKAHLEASLDAVDARTLEGAYDLTRDPSELDATLVPDERARALIERRADFLRVVLDPRFELDLAPLGRADEDRLRALGYLEEG